MRKSEFRPIFVNYGKAIQAYMRLLVSKEAPFDKYVAGDYSAFTTQQKNGLKQFIDAGKCVSCPHGTELRGRSVPRARGSADRTSRARDRSRP